MKTQHGIKTVIFFHSPTPRGKAVCVGGVLIEEIVVPLYASNRDARPAPPLPMFCFVSEKIPSPLSHAQQLAIILIEGVVAAWMNSGFFCSVDFTLPRSISQVVFPQTSFFFSPYTSAPFLLLFCNRRVFSVGQVKRSIAQFSARTCQFNDTVIEKAWRTLSQPDNCGITPPAAPHPSCVE